MPLICMSNASAGSARKSLPRRCDVRTNHACLASAGGTHTFVDEKQPGLDGSPGRHRKTLLPACRCNVSDDTPQPRSGRLQILSLEKFLDQRISNRFFVQAPLRSPGWLIKQSLDSAGRTVAPDQQVERGPA